MSSKPRIERLQLANFRGATKPVVFQFAGQQPITLIFGENGTGKSTIADALDFLCNNDFGSLRLRSGTTPRTHIVAAHAQAKDLVVEMQYAGHTWRATLQSGKPVTTPARAPRAFILRRADITRIMEATDSERYKALQEFITVPQIETAEGALRTLCKTVEEEVQQAIQRKDVAETTLQQFWEAEGCPQDNPHTWAKEALQRPLAGLQEQINTSKALLKALDDALQAEQAVAMAEDHLRQAQAEYAAMESQLQQASQNQTNAELVDVLQAAQSYLNQHPEATACPVCAKPATQLTLLAQIEAQLTQLRQIQMLQRQVEQKERAVQQATGAVNAAQQTWRQAYTALHKQITTETPTLFAEIAFPPFTTPSDLATHATLQQIATQRTALLQQIDQADKTLKQHNALKTHLATIEQLTTTLLDKYDLAKRLKAMLAVVEAERKAFVENTINSVSETVNELYQRIHPQEPLGKPSFGLKKQMIGSLTLTSAFGNNPAVSPAAYYSEAHLDTLGLCVYLALAKATGNALVVLDDVLMSVDDPHLDRVIDLINEEAPHFGHVIITTHSRAWFDRMRQGKGMHAELIELYGWDLQHGMNHSAALPVVEELRSAVQAPKLNRQAVAAGAGILLEQLLDDLTLRFTCALPRKLPAHYTLGELAQGFDKKLGKLLRTEHYDATGNLIGAYELYPLINAATADTWIRNQVGAHFNPQAADIPDILVREFGQHVLALADALLCPHCRQLARKNKSGSYWECGSGCGKIRLYPLTAP